MANQSELSALTAAAKQGDEQAISRLKAMRKAQKESSRRTEELRLRLLQLTDRHWEQAVSILKGWMNKD